MSRKRDGFPSIFRDKTGDKVQARLTTVGSVRFTNARRRLAKLAGLEVERVKDSDVVEFLARGERETVSYLKQNPME